MSLETRARTDVRPFRALRFDPRRVRLADVVTPPYDVITGEQRERFLARSPYNVVRLILPDPGEEDAAGRLLCEWMEQGIIVEDAAPSLYWLEQRYVGPDGVPRERSGVITGLRLDAYGEGGVRPHERTLAGPKAGRLRLMRAVRANLSPIFGIYEDPEQRVARTVLPALAGEEPVMEVRDDDGTWHRLLRIGDEAVAAEVCALIAETTVVIADGHHRYETALAYRLERRAADGEPPGDRPYDFAPIYLASSSDPGLQIFPTHRVVSGLDPALVARLDELLARRFDVETAAGDADAVFDALDARGHERRAFALWRGGGQPALIATLRDPGDIAEAVPGASPATQALDVTALGALVLDELLGLDAEAVASTERIRYPRRAAEAARLVAAEPAGTAVALLVRAPSIPEVEAVAAAGETMPQKSTYFFPKILDGMVFHHLDSC